MLVIYEITATAAPTSSDSDQRCVCKGAGQSWGLIYQSVWRTSSKFVHKYLQYAQENWYLAQLYILCSDKSQMFWTDTLVHGKVLLHKERPQIVIYDKQLHIEQLAVDNVEHGKRCKKKTLTSSDVEILLHEIRDM